VSTGARGLALALGLLLPACDAAEPGAPATAELSEPAGPAAASAPAQPVGRARCAACHPAESERWSGSHHDRAMQEASPASVLGDFEASPIVHRSARFEPARRGERFLVRTEDAAGAPLELEVAYAFGVEPLQQYLVRRPGGRLQVLPIAWDSRPAAAGGQRWFHLYPDEAIPWGDVLHWDGINQGWNHMCAACHSTGVRKGYRVGEDRYETTVGELDVSCEACHGPGSAHAAFREASGSGLAEPGADPRLPVRFPPPAEWVFDPGAPVARRSPPLPSRAEVETCGRCHARRSTLSEDPPGGAPLADTHRVALLREGLYEPDGQIRDEVYEYGSFLSSRMYAAGVTCGDCHNPHSLALAAPGDATCARCHRPEAFATRAHHRHAEGSPGASCMACHMPARVYMGIDERRDHGFRVPRPDLSVRFGTPDACTECHRDRAPGWAARAVEGWHGPPRSHWAEALARGQRGAADTHAALRDLALDPGAPAIVRATALELLPLAGADDLAALRAALREPDPLLRAAAAAALESVDPAARIAAARPCLRDPVRLVREAAARALAAVPPRDLDGPARAELDAALGELRRSLELSADRPEALVALGALEAELGELGAARAAYERALARGPWYVPAYLNLADLRRLEGRDAEGERWLRRALELAPEGADVHHALGLWLWRAERREEAVTALGRAAELEPRSARYALAYGLALRETGREDAAQRVLREIPSGATAAP
jgi:tetratricopeptide (TPR) repeat protein